MGVIVGYDGRVFAVQFLVSFCAFLRSSIADVGFWRGL